MNTTEKTIIALMIVAAIGLLIYASSGPRDMTTNGDGTYGNAQDMKGKVAAGMLMDGEYYVRVGTIAQNPEDTTVTLRHVTYFEGDDARNAAAHDVPCTVLIDMCVPTLTEGYYVRESGAPMVTVPLTTSTKIILINKYTASIADLVAITNDPATSPVFVATVKSGNLVQIEQKISLHK